MSRPLEQALTGLIPSHNGPLPPELTTLAASLLAQSRSKASSLKPEEEIARTYACAHLACERLKQRLNLPSIQPRPPVAPRTYKKVYSYFENALNGTGTPRKQQQQQQRPQQSEQDAEEATTPSKRRTPGTAGRGRATPRSSRAAEAKEDGEPPEWSMPLIRALCKAFAAPAAVPHVYAGLRSVVRLTSSSSSLSSSTRSRPARETARAKSLAEDELPALIVVLLLFVMTRMSGVANDQAEHDARREKAVTVLVDNGHANSNDKEALSQQIDAIVSRAIGQKWIDDTQEWWGNVGEGVGLGVDNGNDEEAERAGDDANDDDGDIEMTDAPATVLSAERRRQRRRSSAAGGGAQNDTPLKQSRTDSSSLRGGLGTMMQESVDYLSEEKRRDFKVWRAKIMERIEQIEREGKENEKAETTA
ncbi:origin recognition complex, subunit 6 [Phyllosticta capitalensis]